MSASEEVLRERPWSRVVRRGDVFIKTVAPSLRQEIGLHDVLSERHPELVPAPLETEKEAGRMTLADAGPPLREDVTLTDWEALLPLYAKLQRAEADQVESLLALGVPDRRPAALRVRFANLEGIAGLVEAVEAGPVPLSLHHGDLHDGNVFRGGALGYRILDWGDASVSHPFCSLRTAMVSIESRFSLEESDPTLERLRAVYLSEWTDLAPLGALQALERRVRPLSSLVSALSWERALSCATPDEAAPFSHVEGALLSEYRAEIIRQVC